MLVFVQNDPEVPDGTYGECLRELGVPFRTVCPYAGEALPQIGEVSAVIVLGGSMGVHETSAHPFLAQVKEFISGCVCDGLPFLGICLGGQLLASVLGARVDSGRQGENGALPVTLTQEGMVDPLFAGIEREFITFQWHDDSFAIPSGAIRLASSSACPNQAFRYGANAYGTQFHPEVNRTIVDSWAQRSDETAPRSDLVAAFARAETAYCRVSRLFLTNFLQIAGSRQQAAFLR